ncbi:MAG TPA: cytochrome c [Methylomirabilota bacterium]|nr:cytochrome c [Methylomirabilota bacterium]
MTGRRRLFVAAGVVGLLAGLGFWAAYREEPAPTVRVPELSLAGQAGRAAFQRSCASCHGDVGQGTMTGPPLVHAIYRPGHHADVAFELAVRRGVRAHHWRFGDMPPQPTVTPGAIPMITRYVRELQQANGID